LNVRNILIVVAIGMIAIVAIAVPRFRTGYLRLAEPPSPKPEVGSTNWTLPPQSVGRVFDMPEEPPMSRNDAATQLNNPQSSTSQSIERGKKAFLTFCMPCHGAGGHSDGPIANKLAFAPPDLPSNTGRRSDGYLYATIRNGGILMPPQGYRIAPAERWDIVNFLRSIQKQ